MEKKYTITLRLSYDQFAWLGALCRRSKQTQSAVIRSLIESGTVRERITKEDSLLLPKDARRWRSVLTNS